MLVISIVALFLTFLLTYIVKVITLKRSILDIPNDRSSHSIPTPRGGGVAVSIIWFLAISFLYVMNELDSTIFLSLLCGIPVALIGVVDDLFKISPKLRLIVQTISSVLAIVMLGGLQTIDLGFIRFSTFFIASFFAIIGLIWFTNIFNFLDGIDGYLGSEVVFIGIASFFLFGSTPALVLAAVNFGFLIWNWQPAKIFMGDVGSTLLGFNIGIFAIYYQNIDVSSILIWLMLTSLFWFDATMTLFRRWKNGETLSKAHRKHAYQRIVQSGFSHQKTVIFSILINLLIMILVLLSVNYPKYSFLFFALNLIFLFFINKSVDKRFPFSITPSNGN